MWLDSHWCLIVIDAQVVSQLFHVGFMVDIAVLEAHFYPLQFLLSVLLHVIYQEDIRGHSTELLRLAPLLQINEETK
jgi:hypothetical protein